MSQLMPVTDADFEALVLKSPTPVIVDFWAEWCPPCRQLAPGLEKIASEYAGKVVVVKVNTDENPELPQHFEIVGIPTMLFIAGGQVVHRHTGAVPFGYLKTVVDKFLEVVSEPAAPTAQS
jgi:thioredoxin 1